MIHMSKHEEASTPTTEGWREIKNKARARPKRIRTFNDSKAGDQRKN